MDDIRLGVIGLGVRSDMVGLAHRPGAGSRRVACCDRDRRILDAAPERFGAGVRTTTDHRELLDAKLDAGFILTPDHTHEPLGRISCGPASRCSWSR
ncbi:hypothetical protein ACFU6I_45910 [Streptomyces sp. NPDC057486]|uniref:hypothetical protein n=1 Tax=Streptomyces sp. NPDC057486 TaxID=3346145 RepID=UPI0036B67C70